MSDLHVLATIVSKHDRAADLRSMLTDAVDVFRQEDGCLGYTLLEDQRRPGRFITYERWSGMAALEAHMKTPFMATIVPLLPDLLDAEIVQEFLDALLVA